jgi:DNA-binding MarR family transcriptional regulator
VPERDKVMRLAAFRAALREFQSHSDEVARHAKLTPQRFLLLLFIKGAPDGSERATFTQLKDRMRVSPNTVTELVARSEEAGLITRERAAHDQRVVYLSLTPEGERRLDAAIARNDGNRRHLTDAFDALVEGFRSA